MSNTTDSYEAMNRLRVYGGCRIDRDSKPAAYIQECRAKRIINNEYPKAQKEVEKLLGYNIPIDKLRDKVMRADDKLLQDYLLNIEEQGFVTATFLILKKRVGRKNG